MNIKLWGGIVVTVLVVVGIVWAHNRTPVESVILEDSSRDYGKEEVQDEQLAKRPLGAGTGNPSSLLGRTWVWQKSVSLGVTSTPTKPGIFTLTFESDGNVTGTTDCNGFGGEYTVASDGVLRFEPFVSTLMYCENSQEGLYNTVLAQTKQYEITDEGILILSGDAGAVYFK